jgi:hypothetical protein
MIRAFDMDFIRSCRLVQERKTSHVKGTNHMSYTDLPYFSPFLNNILLDMSGLKKVEVNQRYCTETMNQLILQFFNFYLKQEGAFEAASEY